MTRASALGMSSSDLRTFLKDTSGISDANARASSWRGIMSGDLTLYWPVICLMTSWESITNSAFLPPSSRTLDIPAMSPRYSA